MIARQHAQSAGVYGQRLVNGELSRKVRDGGAFGRWKSLRHPGVPGGTGGVESFDGGIVGQAQFSIGPLEVLEQGSAIYCHGSLTCNGGQEIQPVIIRMQ